MPLGVFASRCSGRVDETVDLTEALRDVSGSAQAVCIVDDLFDPGVAAQIVSEISGSDIDSVVLAGNSVEHFSKSASAGHLLDVIEAAGVNRNKVVIANLLEQAALAHPDDPAGATAKARALVNVAALFAEGAQATDSISSTPTRRILILGVNDESLLAAQRLLQLGYEVTLADRGDGTARALASSMRATAARVLDDDAAEIVDHARLSDADGWLGDYRVELATSAGGVTEQRFGGIVLAEPTDEEWVAEMRDHFRVDVDDDGFARALDPTRHPVETIDPGIMVISYREGGRMDRDKVAAADAVAMALLLRLSGDAVSHHHDVSEVDDALCGGCASCVRTCVFGACLIDAETGVSYVDERRCRACGKCVVACPVGARDILSAPHDLLVDAVHELAATQIDGPKVIGFLCGGCGYPAADSASDAIAMRGDGYDASFLPLRIPCGGRLDALYVLEAFKSGFDGVCVYRCREGHCHNLIGNLDMDRRINLLRTVLRSRGIDDARLRIVDISPTEGEHFIESVEEVFTLVKGGAA